jgi:hypothetical protein
MVDRTAGILSARWRIIHGKNRHTYNVNATHHKIAEQYKKWDENDSGSNANNRNTAAKMTNI